MHVTSERCCFSYYAKQPSSLQIPGKCLTLWDQILHSEFKFMFLLYFSMLFNDFNRYTSELI